VKTFVVVADLFKEQYVGGAELTTDAIIENKKNKVNKINSHALTEKIIDENKDKIWLIFNFSNIDEKILVKLAKTVEYSIIEYDYKFCNYRSIDLHQLTENKKCDCMNRGFSSKIRLIFYGYAKKIWFMSHKQREIFLKNVTSIKKENTEVLSSVFSKGDLLFIDSISQNEKDESYLILDSSSWIKGTKECIEFAKSNGLKFELIKGLKYHELLIKMSTSKGLIFRPLGGDTCPRIVIEAKLLGCDIIMNENVQHKDEQWFSSKEKCKEYLSTRVDKFWSWYE
tara:strand:- start:932 stop:1780 length:849 start_codon:yes stop_codon:yes gene_type:complete